MTKKKLLKTDKPQRNNKGKFLPGNQCGVGNEGGRPLKYDLEQEAQDLLKWSLRDDATSLYRFTDHKEYLAQQLSQFAEQSTAFSLALKKAKERIAIRREDQCNSEIMNYGVWSRSVSLYDKLVDDVEEDKKEKELERKKRLIDYEIEKKIVAEQQKNAPPHDSELNEIIAQLKQLKEKQHAHKRQANTEL